MFACLVQIISHLDIQSKFEMFTPSICLLRCWCKLEVHQHGDSKPILGCVNYFVQNVLKNIWSLWKWTAHRPKTCKSVFFIFKLICYCVNSGLCVYFFPNLINYKKSLPFFAEGISSIIAIGLFEKLFQILSLQHFHEIYSDATSVWTEEKSYTFALSKDCLHSI